LRHNVVAAATVFSLLVVQAERDAKDEAEALAYFQKLQRQCPVEDLRIVPPLQGVRSLVRVVDMYVCCAASRCVVCCVVLSGNCWVVLWCGVVW
jgi:hypothetical protein